MVDIYLSYSHVKFFLKKTHSVRQFCPCGGSFLPCVSLKIHLWITICPPFLKFPQVDLKTFRAWLDVLCILIFIYSSSLWSQLCSVGLKGISVSFFVLVNTIDNRYHLRIFQQLPHQTLD